MRISAIIILLYTSLSCSAQMISREIVTLDEQTSSNNSITKIDLVYKNDRTISFNKNQFEIDINTTNSLLYIQITYGQDTLQFCQNEVDAIFKSMPEEFRKDYLEKYKNSFINSPFKWEFVVDHPPFGTYYGVDHEQSFGQKDNDNSCVMYHLRIISSQMIKWCQE